jgi:hypothetical protein
MLLLLCYGTSINDDLVATQTMQTETQRFFSRAGPIDRTTTTPQTLSRHAVATSACDATWYLYWNPLDNCDK